MRNWLLSWLTALFLAVTLTGCVVVTEIEPERPESPGPHQGTGDGSGEGYSFLHTLEDGEPVRWSTCEPIRYVVRERNQPEGAGRLLRQSIDRISEITGLEFSGEGTTREGPRPDRRLYQPNRYGEQWAPVLIAYSSAEEDPRLRGQVAGFGGAAFVSGGRAPARYVSGSAVFDVEQLARMDGEEATRAVMLHELAHVVGLGHVDDRGQLMNPVQYGRGVTTLQDGDIAGLEILGDGECYEPVDPSRVQPRG